MEKEKIRLQALDIGESKLVRIEWLGDIVGDEHKRIRVSVSRIGSSVLDLFPQPDLIDVDVSIGYLHLLRLGSLWENGVCVRDEQRAGDSIEELSIDSRTATVVSSGSRLGPGSTSFLLPYSQFELHSRHTSSLLVKARLNESMSVLVPCSEVIRFYFGESGNLVKQLVSGRLALEGVTEGSRIFDGNANVILPTGWHPCAVPYMARICFDPAAKIAAKRLAESGVVAAVNGREWYPRMDLPFSGTTKITARGRWIEHKDHRVFLVLRLLRCTHPFPYSKVFYKYPSSVTAGDVPAKVQRKSTIDKSGPIAKTKRTLSNRPYGEGAKITVEAREYGESPFPDLANKRVVHAGMAKVIGTIHQSDSPAELLTAGGSTGLSAREMELVVTNLGGVDPEAAPVTLWHFDRELRLLRPDLKVITFPDGHGFGRFWVEQSFAGLYSQRWVGIRLLATAGGGATEQALALICAEERIDGDAPEFLVLQLEPLCSVECASRVQKFLAHWGWRVGTCQASHATCVLALSSNAIDRALVREAFSGLVGSVSSKCSVAPTDSDLKIST
ncbi:hypothetical protein ACIGHN_10750 [Acidovorax sp. NPDC077693]|uniref:hypothetical protein n=1 Tax=unclassified Acidovorax TaxID=2684926 RepID=UPI0037C70276